MKQPDNAQNVEPCDICGAVGFPEVIVTCCKCKKACEHVYCMRIFLRIVPEVWICESCHSRNDTISPKYFGNKISSGDLRLDASDITDHEIAHSTSSYKKHRAGCQACTRSQKVVGTGKVKFIPAEEAIRLSCGELSSKTFPANSSMHKTWKTNGQSEKVISNIPFSTVKRNPNLPMGHWKLPRHTKVQKNSMTNQQAPHSLSKVKSKFIGVSMDRTKEYDLREHSSSSIGLVNKETSRANALKANDKASYSTAATSLPIRTSVTVETLDVQVEKHTKNAPCAALHVGQSSPIVDSGGTSCANGEYGRSNIEERDLQSIQMNFGQYCYCLPSSRATWRGGFKFLQSEFYDGFEAQPPCTVNRKAYNFSCKMPAVLEVEPLPMSSLLTDLFQDNRPDLQDVALYFFPSDNSERSRQNLNCIFAVLDAKNCMLRSIIDGVELLVFTSNHLNGDSQGITEKVTTKYFLWGIFRPVKNDKAFQIPDTQAVDMDIDMVGGKYVLGRTDIVRNPKDKKPGNVSVSSGEGTLLQNTSGKVEDKKTLTTSCDLNLKVQDKISLSTDLKKKIKTESVDMDIDMVGGKDVLGRIDIVRNPKGKPGNVSISSGGGTLLQNTSEKVEDKKTLTTSSDLNLKVQRKISLSTDTRKTVKKEFPLDIFPLKSVDEYHKIMDKNDVPPGFEEVHGRTNLQPPSPKLKRKRIYDLY